MVSHIVDIINIVVNVFSFVFVLMSSLSKSFSEYNTPRKDCWYVDVPTRYNCIVRSSSFYNRIIWSLVKFAHDYCPLISFDLTPEQRE